MIALIFYVISINQSRALKTVNQTIEGHSVPREQTVSKAQTQTQTQELSIASSNQKPNFQAALNDSNSHYQDEIKIENNFTKLAPYLEGTSIDGRVSFDESGNIVFNEDLLNFLEYHFSAVGVASAEEINSYLHGLIEKHLQSPAKEQAYDFLKKYADYQERINTVAPPQVYDSSSIENDALTYEMLDLTLQQQSQLRKEIFGIDVAESIWREEEAYNRYALEKARLKSGPIDQQTLDNFIINSPFNDLENESK